MPFTFSHPVFVVPFTRQSRISFSLSGLLAGSMVPDFEYFLKFRAAPEIGEWPVGQYFFNLPLAIILVLSFHLFIKEPLILHLPKPYNQRYGRYARLSFLDYLGRHYITFVGSILLGMFTHLLIDWVLYPQGPLESYFSLLPKIAGLHPALYLERTVSVVALLYLSWFLLRYKPTQTALVAELSARKKWIFWLVTLLLSLSIFTYKLWPFPEHFTPWLIAGLSSGMFGLTTTSIFWKLFRKKTSVWGVQKPSG